MYFDRNILIILILMLVCFCHKPKTIEGIESMRKRVMLSLLLTIKYCSAPNMNDIGNNYLHTSVAEVLRVTLKSRFVMCLLLLLSGITVLLLKMDAVVQK